MESIFKDPTGVKNMIEEGMKGKLKEGELDKLEFMEIEESLETPSTGLTPKVEKLTLRGEGGSGEKKMREVGDSVVTPDTTPKAQQRGEVDWEEAEEESSRGEWMGDRDQESRTTGSNAGDEVRELKGEIRNLRMWMEDQIRALNQIITPLQVRIQRMEATAAPSVPLASLERRPSKTQSIPSTSSPPRPSTRSGVGIPRLGSPPPTIQEVVVRTFLSKSKEYPSLQVVRKAKLRQLQSLCNLPSRDIDVSVSEWTLKGLTQTLKEAHHLTD